VRAPVDVCIQRGDIVIFHPPVEGYQGLAFVKRVVAVGGDVVTIRGGRVFVDGNAVGGASGTTPGTTFPDEAAVYVPDGAVFVLGGL
jgi:signal peptidase I